MKVVILAGGLGTRISEESQMRPKPMVEIGGKPILWHIMKIYSHYGFSDFIVCLGYKSYMIKEYFANYFLHQSDVTFDFRAGNKLITHQHTVEPWRVTLIDTGLNTMTGGRVKRVKDYIGNEPFMLTYGDGVADIDVAALLKFHKEHGKMATVTSVQPEGRFGALDINATGMVRSFMEKPQGDGNWINAGFFVLQPEVIDYIDGDTITFEKEPLQKLAQQNQLLAYRHKGFWRPMDTLREKNLLEGLWENGNAPWRCW